MKRGAPAIVGLSLEADDDLKSQVAQSARQMD
jgi:hypothetical protein